MRDDTDGVLELWKQQAASDVSLREKTAELTKFKALPVEVTAETLEVANNTRCVGEGVRRRLKELAVVRRSLVIVKRSVRSIVGLSVKTEDGFVNQVKSQLGGSILHRVVDRVFLLSNGFSMNVASYFCCADSLYWTKESHFFLVGKVRLLLLQIFRRLFLRNLRLLLRKGLVVVSRKLAKNYIHCLKLVSSCHCVKTVFLLLCSFVVFSVESPSVTCIFVRRFSRCRFQIVQ